MISHRQILYKQLPHPHKQTRCCVLRLYLYALLSDKIEVVADHDELKVVAKRDFINRQSLGCDLLGHVTLVAVADTLTRSLVVLKQHSTPQHRHLHVKPHYHPYTKPTQEKQRSSIAVYRRTQSRYYYLTGPLSYVNTGCHNCMNLLHVVEKQRGEDVINDSEWYAATVCGSHCHFVKAGDELLLNYTLDDNDFLITPLSQTRCNTAYLAQQQHVNDTATTHSHNHHVYPSHG